MMDKKSPGGLMKRELRILILEDDAGDGWAFRDGAFWHGHPDYYRGQSGAFWDAKIAANRAQYSLVEPTELPDRPGTNHPNILEYALRTDHPLGTPLYRRLEAEGRLLYDAWWNDASYRYNMVPFQPQTMSPEELSRRCIEARRKFYSWPSIVQRGLHSRGYHQGRFMVDKERTFISERTKDGLAAAKRAGSAVGVASSHGSARCS